MEVTFSQYIPGTRVFPGGNCGSNKRSTEYTDYVEDEDEFDLDFDPDFVAPVNISHQSFIFNS